MFIPFVTAFIDTIALYVNSSVVTKLHTLHSEIKTSTSTLNDEPKKYLRVYKFHFSYLLTI